MTWSIEQADCIGFLRGLPADSVDLVFGSPPYEEARLYLEDGKDMGIARKTEEWVAWMVEVYRAAQVACKGLVAFVVAGQTSKFRWSAGPALLAADLHRAGFNLRNPPIFHRVGIPGSGGPDWLRGDYEWIICTSRPGKLPWSDNTALGHPPKWEAGGQLSFRTLDGTRVNEPREYSRANRTSGYKNGDTTRRINKSPVPEKANPGNVIKCLVGGGRPGDEFSNQNEAPFPEALAEFFVLSFCPPGGVVCDPFSGSGTTGAVSVRHSRNFVGCDLRESQVQLARRRLENETPMMFSGDSSESGS